MATQQQSLISVTVDGAPLGIFDTLSGGATTADATKRRAGGGQLKSYAALPDTDDLTVSRDYDRERDHEKLRELRRRVGRAPVSVSEQPLDDDGAPWGKPTTYTGRLTGVNPGDADSNSGDVRMLELTIQVTEVA
jgi:hypothetical protein